MKNPFDSSNRITRDLFGGLCPNKTEAAVLRTRVSDEIPC
jgi:hypothetical protein